MKNTLQGWAYAVFKQGPAKQDDLMCLFYIEDRGQPPPGTPLSRLRRLQQEGWLDDQLRPSWPTDLISREVQDD